MKRLIVSSFVVLSLALVSVSTAQQPATSSTKSTQQTDRQQQPDMGAILVKGLKSTPGCIGVKSCRWDDGKNSIVAWFENKDAVVTWYHSATHQAMIGGKTKGFSDKEPLEHVKNEDQPIMVIATLTPSSKPELPGINIPISQISIELFAALPGGTMVGGRVSPKEFIVPHMNDYSPPKAKEIESNGNGKAASKNK